MQLSKYCIVEGRRPEGMKLPEALLGSVMGDYFARVSFFEASSAMAFERLGRELELYGAPEHLVHGCERARRAEVRHARAFGILAERFGARPTTPKPRHLRVRSLVDLARANIVEGFVRETYGAAAARFRARSAADPGIAIVMTAVAVDEGDKAELAFSLAKWLQLALDPIEGIWIEDAMSHAVVALARELDVEVDPELVLLAGVPSRRDALSIWSGLSHRVWHGISEKLWCAAA